MGGGGVLRGTVMLGTLVGFMQYAQRFFRPIQDLSEKYNILQAAMAASERVFKLLDTPPEIVSPANPKAGRRFGTDRVPRCVVYLSAAGCGDESAHRRRERSGAAGDERALSG